MTVHAVHDAVGDLFLPAAEAFPAATEAAWRAARALDPASFSAAGTLLMSFRCFLVRVPGGPTIVVDAGIGPSDAPAKSWAPVPGELPEGLAAIGVDPHDVDVVVLTHLHTDHLGWAMADWADKPRAYFPNARYVLQRDEVDAIDAINPQCRELLLDPLLDADQLDLPAGERQLAAGVKIVPTPGHTPGHQAVLVTGGDETLAISGDVAVHAVQVVDPLAAYSVEMDQDAARLSRRWLLETATVLASSHLTEPFLNLPRRGA